MKEYILMLSLLAGQPEGIGTKHLFANGNAILKEYDEIMTNIGPPKYIVSYFGDRTVTSFLETDKEGGLSGITSYVAQEQTGQKSINMISDWKWANDSFILNFVLLPKKTLEVKEVTNILSMRVTSEAEKKHVENEMTENFYIIERDLFDKGKSERLEAILDLALMDLLDKSNGVLITDYDPVRRSQYLDNLIDDIYKDLILPAQRKD